MINACFPQQMTTASHAVNCISGMQHQMVLLGTTVLRGVRPAADVVQCYPGYTSYMKFRAEFARFTMYKNVYEISLHLTYSFLEPYTIFAF